MIINAYAVLVAFTGLLRALIGVLVVCTGVGAWRRWSRARSAETRKSVEDRTYLVLSLAFVLLWLNLAAWPLFYLLLQSYVPQWPDVMCIYGVTRIGASPYNVGPSRFLPTLLTALQVAKPAIVFLSGAWFVVYLVNRRTRTAPLMKRLLAVLVALGLLSFADSAAEATYLVIPKKEKSLAMGCCTGSLLTSSGRFAPQSLVRPEHRPLLTGIFYATNALFATVLLLSSIRARRSRTRRGLIPVLLGAILASVVTGVFLTETLAPALLGMPDHHCIYDLPRESPLSVVGIALFVGGVFSAGWAFAANWLARSEETDPILPEFTAKLLLLAFSAHAASVLLFSVDLAFAV